MSVVNYEKKGKIAIITLNRPEALNALSIEVWAELDRIYKDFEKDPDLWVAIITGAGEKAFSAGADIKEFDAEPMEIEGLEDLPRPHRIMKPFIAAINGFALGGGLELAMMCDIRIAAEHAKLGQPEVNIGYMPGAGGTQYLPRLIPMAIANEIVFTGEPITAQEGYRIGLINKVVPMAELMPTAMKMAETICSKAPLGARAAKEAMMRGRDMSLDEGLKLEMDIANGIRETEDFIEGARAFTEKRKPVYKGK